MHGPVPRRHRDLVDDPHEPGRSSGASAASARAMSPRELRAPAQGDRRDRDLASRPARARRRPTARSTASEVAERVADRPGATAAARCGPAPSIAVDQPVVAVVVAAEQVAGREPGVVAAEHAAQRRRRGRRAVGSTRRAASRPRRAALAREAVVADASRPRPRRRRRCAPRRCPAAAGRASRAWPGDVDEDRLALGRRVELDAPARARSARVTRSHSPNGMPEPTNSRTGWWRSARVAAARRRARAASSTCRRRR